MPLIRYTYGPDIAKHGDQPILVEDVELRTLVEMRRAVPVEAAELAELPKAALLEVAEEAGVEVKKSAPKAKVAEAITEAKGK